MPYTCQTCGKKCTSFHGLTQHVSNTHNMIASEQLAQSHGQLYPSTELFNSVRHGMSCIRPPEYHFSASNRANGHVSTVRRKSFDSQFTQISSMESSGSSFSTMHTGIKHKHEPRTSLNEIDDLESVDGVQIDDPEDNSAIDQ